MLKLPSVTVTAAHGTDCVAEVAGPPIGLVHTKSCSKHQDDTARIQAAIDKVSAWPLKSAAPGGSQFRGRVRLGAGTFFVSKALRVRHSGVILEGVGGHCRPNTVAKVQKASMCTNIIAEGGLDAVVILGLDTATVREVPSSRSGAWRTKIAQSYVPAGAMQVRVADASGFAVGDNVVVERKATDKWIKAIGMDALVEDHKVETWVMVRDQGGREMHCPWALSLTPAFIILTPSHSLHNYTA